MVNYGFTKELNISYEAVIGQMTEALKKEGFWVQIQIDVQANMKEKMDIDMGKYIILAACSFPNAYKAILAEEDIGLMFPWNIIVYEKDGKTVLSVIRPTVSMQMVDNAEIQIISEEVEGKLKAAFDAVK